MTNWHGMCKVQDWVIQTTQNIIGTHLSCISVIGGVGCLHRTQRILKLIEINVVFLSSKDRNYNLISVHTPMSYNDTLYLDTNQSVSNQCSCGSRRMKWSVVLRAAQRSRWTGTDEWPTSAAKSKSFITLSSTVAVLRWALNPDWDFSKRPFLFLNQSPVS